MKANLIAMLLDFEMTSRTSASWQSSAEAKLAPDKHMSIAVSDRTSIVASLQNKNIVAAGVENSSFVGKCSMMISGAAHDRYDPLGLRRCGFLPKTMRPDALEHRTACFIAAGVLPAHGKEIHGEANGGGAESNEQKPAQHQRHARDAARDR
jgi:hypothetical protein